MTHPIKPIILLDPAPRLVSDIFSAQAIASLRDAFTVLERGAETAAEFYEKHLVDAQFIIGQPGLDTRMIERAANLKAVINVEGNFLQNMDYDACFRRNIHVLSISPVFAQPVAELALGLALSLARDIPRAHQSFQEGTEQYGLAGNQTARLLMRCRLGFIGFGDLGRAILSVFFGFSPSVRVYDPWVSPEVLRREGLEPATLAQVLEWSDVIPVVASVTEQSTKLIGKSELQKMRPGAHLLLLSRAEVVDFDALMDACDSGHIRAAVDVFPIEPLPSSHRLRTTPNIILSAHRAGALNSALLDIGDRTLADVKLMASGLPPQNCKRAEPELVGRARSKPVDKS